MKNKKGVISLREVPTAVMLLVTIGILLGIGALILATMQDTQKNSISNTAANETHPVGNASATYLGFAVNSSGPDYFLVSIDNVINTTSGANIEAGNYSFNANGSIDWIGNATWSINLTDQVDISYTYSTRDLDSFYNITGSANEGLENFSDFQPIIAIVIAAAVILGLVFLIRT